MKSTNNKTFDQVNKLIAANPYSMNTLCISFSYEFAANAATLNWYDILFAIEQGFLDHRSAIKHAQSELECENYPQAVLNLACISSDESVFPHSIHPHIDNLANNVSDVEKEKTRDKIMYILLKWVCVTVEFGLGRILPWCARQKCLQFLWKRRSSMHQREV